MGARDRDPGRFDSVMKPAGKLPNGKSFFGDAAHPGNKHLDAQDHAEAAHQLVSRAKKMMTSHGTFDDEFAIQHAKRLSNWAGSHAKMARVKGIPQKLAASEMPFRKNEALDIDKARAELGKESLAEIQRKTARTWAARAIVSYRMAEDASGPDELFKRFTDGDEYRHEAIEHASLIMNDGKFLPFIQSAIDSAREKVDLSPLGIESLGKYDVLAGQATKGVGDLDLTQFQPTKVVRPRDVMRNGFRLKKDFTIGF